MKRATSSGRKERAPRCAALSDSRSYKRFFTRDALPQNSCHKEGRNHDDSDRPSVHCLHRGDSSWSPHRTGTRTPVRAIAELWKFGIAPEGIIGRLPHLTLAQVFDALSYYPEHREAIDEDIQQNRVPAEKIHPHLQ